MNNGSRLVIIILILGALISGLTFWNYSQHVFSTNHALLLNQTGLVEAVFPAALSRKIHEHQQAHITLGKRFFKAEVLSTLMSDQETRVQLHLIEKNLPALPLSPDEACGVTIDTTLPLYQ